MPPDKTWKLSPSSPAAALLARGAGVTPLQAQLLINRGISDPNRVYSFLHPRLANMADPMLLRGMRDAVATILKSIKKQEKITIYGDYDVDGLTATALLVSFFSSLDIPVSFYIPNRLDEGYGLNKDAVERIANSGAGLIITVDCGISNVQEIALAESLGLKVVVTDHHQVPKGFRAICPVVNPHQPDCPFPFKELSGVGLAFFLAVSIRAGLRERGWFTRRDVPDLKQYLDLVALGTVADRVPLVDQNRILVKSGMGVMTRTRWAGIRALMEVADVEGSDITTDNLAFRLAPRLNAPGRMGDPETGMEILTVEDTLLAEALAFKVNRANSERQVLERQILHEIEEMIKTKGGFTDSTVLVVAGKGWHKGVLGIVASRLVEKYHRPSLVIGVQDGVAVGSARSIDGFNLYEALSQLDHIFEKYGGHAHAAGFTLKEEKVQGLRRGLEAITREALGFEDLIPTVEVDVEIRLDQITPQMIRQVRALSPFGEGNPEPIFLARSLKVLESRIVGDRHLRLRLRQEGRPFEAIGFSLAGRYPLEGKTINMLFTPELTRWRGYERIQLRVVDLKMAAN